MNIKVIHHYLIEEEEGGVVKPLVGLRGETFEVLWFLGKLKNTHNFHAHFYDKTTSPL